MSLASCPYYVYLTQGGERGTCTFGCREEPACITDEPEGGWPAAGDTANEPCPAGEGEHCAHWFDGEPCCFCQLDGPTRVPEVVTVEIPGVSW